MFARTSLLLLLGLSLSAAWCGEVSAGTVDVFYKEKPPSLSTLARADSVLAEFGEGYDVARHLIPDSSSVALIEKYGLPSSHFPFAIVINGEFSARVEGEKVDFVHFPLFMHGIGRHEGNWSMEHLGRVLRDTTLLMDESVLPVLDEAGDTKCPGE